MKNLTKIIGTLTLGAFAASLIPYRFKQDKETGAFELGAVLWALKKTPGEEQDTYTVELLPLLNKEEKSDEAFDEDLFEDPFGEPAAEELADKVAEAAEVAAEAAEEVAGELG